jgi:hypothetical protein
MGNERKCESGCAIDLVLTGPFGAFMRRHLLFLQLSRGIRRPFRAIYFHNRTSVARPRLLP